ncbi:MAG: DNA alkylation response protein, partial [Burkholderia vietnamiensis]|nr:DNA alkylation response protein [Burkholderia vietnamiensis]
MLATPADALEASARLFAQRLALVAQACLLTRDAPAAVADAFIATRLTAPDWGRVAGGFDPRAMDVAALLERAYRA